jgi:hypothetical protein
MGHIGVFKQAAEAFYMIGQQQIAIAMIEDVPPARLMKQNLMAVWFSTVFVFGKIEDPDAMIRTGHILDCHS